MAIDGLVYTAAVNGVWASHPTDPDFHPDVTHIYGYIPADTTVTCP
jgi:hypothetical protein